MTGTSADIGLLALRTVFGLYLTGHGLKKFGLLDGPGLAQTALAFEKGGFRPGRPMATLAGALEVAGGLALVAGFLTPAAAATVVGVMLVAASLHVPNGLWESDKGVELPAVFAAAALTLLLTGPGRVSIDHLAGIDDLAGLPESALLLAVVVVAVTATLIRRRSHLRAAASHPHE
ncbi:DoxX family protein [Actinomadura sp. KC06]|uniref:DoxX family protein n=1 Tax=Actinomadura sp. KC06 TaxID=2530369 RepID=UPI0010430B20|nr:DoxX family protein [Actinomadura sp. KC06]TDD35863.1 DoxX family protein [Actinomadura sp. KC06]